MPASETVTWGILGCGDVTEIKSGPALQKAERSTLHSVMRRDAAKAADYAARHNVPHWTADADALIQDDRLNAIYIATPPSTHMDYAIRALKAGKNVLLEKPMAMDVAECDAIEQAVKATGQKLSVAYYRRALPRFEALKDLMNDGTLGHVRMIEIRHFLQQDDRPGQMWKIDPSVGGGGMFVDMQSHTLDWLTYCFGIPDAVRGIKKHQGGHYSAEDLVSFILDFGTFPAVGLCAYASSQREEVVRIHGELGTAEMGFFRPSPISLTIEGTSRQIDLPDPAHVHQPFIERVVAHFLDDAENPCSAAQGAQSTRLTSAIFDGL